jgi:hypothetical protein
MKALNKKPITMCAAIKPQIIMLSYIEVKNNRDILFRTVNIYQPLAKEKIADLIDLTYR